jgi:tetratricopeptide (TPR) repeat protein
MILRWLYRGVAPDALSAVPPGNGQTQAIDTADPEALNRQVEQLCLAGKYVEATELAKEALALAGPVVAKALNNLATLYFVQGRDMDADPLFKRALAVLNKALGPNHPAVAAAHCYLAELRIEQDEQGRAAAYLQRSPVTASSPGSPDFSDQGSAPGLLSDRSPEIYLNVTAA